MRSSAPMDGGAGGASFDEAPDSYTPGSDGQASNDGEIGEQDSAAQAENDMTPIYYSNLMLADGVLDEEVLAFSESLSALMDIASFDESILSLDHCCMIIEGTVVNLYVKHYTYDVYNDKFEKNGILQGRTDTIVYEVANDGSYFVSQDWTTLTAKNAREVIMDTLDEEYSYYRDKMRLVDGKTFAEQMAVLVGNIQ